MLGFALASARRTGHYALVFDCPACGFEGLDEPPWDGDSPSDDICPSRGMQFGYYDSGRRDPLFYAGWRTRWLVEGGH